MFILTIASDKGLLVKVMVIRKHLPQELHALLVKIFNANGFRDEACQRINNGSIANLLIEIG